MCDSVAAWESTGTTCSDKKAGIAAVAQAWEITIAYQDLRVLQCRTYACLCVCVCWSQARSV